MTAPKGIRYVSFDQGLTLKALLAALWSNGFFSQHGRVRHRMAELNVPDGWRTNIALTGEQLSVEASERIWDAVECARDVSSTSSAAASLPWWIWVVVGVGILGLIALVLYGRFCAGVQQ